MTKRLRQFRSKGINDYDRWYQMHKLSKAKHKKEVEELIRGVGLSLTKRRITHLNIPELYNYYESD